MEYTPYEFALDVFDSLRGFIAVDAEGKIVYIAEHYATALGVTQEEAAGRPVEELISNTRLTAVLQQKESEWGRHMHAQSAVTGQYLGYSICNRVLVTRRGNPDEVMGAVAFVAVHRDQNEEDFLEELEYLREKNAMYRKQIAEMYQARDDLNEILGRSLKATQMKELIRKVANTSVSVCICGETGTGKELVANAIHKLSSRAQGPFIKINCAAIPKDLMESELFGYEPGAFTGAARQGKLGMFELANGGTLLLDEIGELPLNLQAKLLRVLQEGELKRVGGVKVVPIDVRLLCSTNRSLKQMVAAGEFRADLYYRINTMEITVPPLRERIEDIPLLTDHFIRSANKRNGLAVSGMHARLYPLLSAYSWPGNIRELEHSIERACVLCGAGYLEEKHFDFLSESLFAVREIPAERPEECSFSAKREKAELDGILQALEACGGNRTKTARMLNISRTTLFRKMKKYCLL